MNQDVAILLLAGGEGRRMGGQDKGLVMLCGQPLYHHVLARMRVQASWLAISANRHLPEYAASGQPVFADDAAWQGMGPLAGVATLAARLPAHIRHVQLVPCDTPALPPDLVSRLKSSLQTDQTLSICYPQTSQGPQPVCALLRREALASLPDYLIQGGRSLRGFFASLHSQAITFDDAAAFANINDPAALASWQARF